MLSIGVQVSAASTINLSGTDSTNEDGGAAGWSIGDSRYLFASGSWTESPLIATHRIDVRGAPVPLPVLIKNTGRSDDATARRLTAHNRKRAQEFTTGANSAGYTLYAIAFDFDTIGSDAISTAGSHLTVTLNEGSDGDPGAALCTLTDPASFSASGVHTFDAPATDRCPTLAASTTYFAVIERVRVTSDTIRLKVTTSSNEDSGGATGWSIGDDYHYFSNGSWYTSYTQAVQAYLVVVSGVARVNNLATGAPTITGTPRVGEELTADTSAIADDDGITTPDFTYQWVRVDGGDETDIGTDASTHILTDDDANQRIRVKVSFTDDGGVAEGAALQRGHRRRRPSRRLGQEHGANRSGLRRRRGCRLPQVWPVIHHRLEHCRLHTEFHRRYVPDDWRYVDRGKRADGNAERRKQRASGQCAVHAQRPGDLHRLRAA